MPGVADPAFRARLDALNEKYAAGLPAAFDRLSILRESIIPPAPDVVIRAKLHETLHTLAGSSATFGFARLGAEARHLEETLRMLDGEAGWDGWLAELDAFLAWARKDPKGA